MDFQTGAILVILVMAFITMIRSVFFPPRKEIVQQERRVRVAQRQEPVDLTNLSVWLQTEIERRGVYAIDPASLLLMFPAGRIQKDDEFDNGEGLYSILPAPEEPPTTLPEMFPTEQPLEDGWNRYAPQTPYPDYNSQSATRADWDLT